MASGNKRIFYACLGVSVGGGGRLQGATSVGISASRDISTVFASQNKNPIATYAATPQIEINISSYLNSFTPLNSELGFSDWTDIAIFAGDDTCPVLAANQKNVFNYVLLSSIKYNLPADGLFTVEKTYQGLNTKPCVISESCNPNAVAQSGTVKTRQYYLGGKPAIVGDNPISNITIDAKINRSFVSEFGTRKPYASYVNFPIELSCTFDCIAQDLDTISFDLAQTACKNSASYKESIPIELCGSTFMINDAQLTNFSYSGAEASSNSNLAFSVTYTAYSTPSGTVPVIIIPDDFDDPC